MMPMLVTVAFLFVHEASAKVLHMAGPVPTGLGLLLDGKVLGDATTGCLGTAYSGNFARTISNSTECANGFASLGLEALQLPAASDLELQAVQLDLLFHRRRLASPQASEEPRRAQSFSDVGAFVWQAEPAVPSRRQLKPVFFSLPQHHGARTLSVRHH
eukprot:gb/GFBE01054974.1/.p1 GENE.gb/GFBE01054974.1/~~gb/GFBE01054974.1/.p1  ORF type:complete len:159 (+),score=31.41 gb/GFBE01054974.1/:1-477(+)